MEEEQVHVTLLQVDCLRGNLQEAPRILSRERYEKMMRYRREEDRLRSFAASLLLRKAAGNRRVFYGREGKPLAEGIFFSLAHSGTYAVLAEAAVPVGVDIEKMEPVGDWGQEALSREEYKWLGQAGDEAERQARFYRLWTRKESLVKCEGRGFAIDPGEISTMPVESQQLVAYAGEAYGICSRSFRGYMLSAALQGKHPYIVLENVVYEAGEIVRGVVLGS